MAEPAVSPEQPCKRAGCGHHGVSAPRVMMDATDNQSPTYSDDELTASLVEHLASLDRDDSYRVERVLKLSDVETTELVYFEGSGGGSLGPFVRKRIDASAQIGGAYERLFAAQRDGRRFEHLPRIVDCHRVGDELDVVMEYVEGETLEALVGRLGATPDYACGLYPVLCEAVGELHAGFAAAGEPRVPVIHRDLKPSNIIVSGVRYAADAGMTFSSLVIIDLGIAHVWRDGADADTVKFGTRPYAPPEQYGFGQTSVRSDIDALGALLFFCLTGTDPKPGPEYARAMRGVRRPRTADRCGLHGDDARSGQALCECGSVGTGDARGIRFESPRAASCACLRPDLGDGVDAPRAPEPRRDS